MSREFRRGWIFSGGSIDAETAEAFMEREKNGGGALYRIAADRGLVFCREHGILPDLILGDFDSAPSAELEYYRERIPERIRSFPPQKDETDTELAVRAAAEAGCREITVFGATGTRLDHVLGNIHLLKQASDRGIRMFLVDAHNRIRLLRGGETCAFLREELYGRYVSLIPFAGDAEGITLDGFAYSVQDFTLRAGSPRGVSNELAADRGTIRLGGGYLLVVESKD